MSDGIEEFHFPVVVVGAKTLGLSGSGAFKDLLNLNNKIERDKSPYGGKDECSIRAKMDRYRLLPLFALS